MMRLRAGEYRFHKIFEGTGGWGSALPYEGWRKPYRFMGPIELKKPKPPPPPPLLFRCRLNGETPKAWRVVINGREHWLPKSHCNLSDDEREIEIPRWLWRERISEQEERRELELELRDG
ncbi:hypothetical protein ABIF78_007684 [Bradyrhizobium japonicum]|jgi:hypothetical protein